MATPTSVSPPSPRTSRKPVPSVPSSPSGCIPAGSSGSRTSLLPGVSGSCGPSAGSSANEAACGRKTLSESTPQVPRFACSTARLKESLKEAVITSGRAASEVAVAFGGSWWLVNAVVVAAAMPLPSTDRWLRHGWGLTSTATAPCGGLTTR